MFQTAEQIEKSAPLSWCSGVGRLTAAVKTTFVTHTDGVGVIAHGMGTYELFVAGLVHRAVAPHVVVVAGEPESVRVVTDELPHRIRLVFACGTTMNYN